MDGGGTHTRVMAVDLAGNVLSYIEKGASSIHKDLHARENVQQAIEEALAQAGRNVQHVQALTAGIAGFDSKADLDWVLPLTALEGLNCLKQHVNDAVVAHRGALLTEPGIIVIAGTGSIIYAINEEGEQIRNYDLHHYAASAARFLAYDATFEILSGNIDDSDHDLVIEILQSWGLTTVTELSQLAKQGFIIDQRERNKKFGQMAPLITKAALQNSKLAAVVCDRAIHQIVAGVEMLAAYFSDSEVSVSFVGSVVNSDYFQRRLASQLSQGNNKTYKLIQPSFSPVAGAVLLALKQLNIPIDQEILNNLSQHPRSQSY
ncbi:BadF/BadG/BcrA/BcrD ATPase family protein [Paenibacillus qinlingensis]|uniref:Glucosamine kinase n=1 Tax=Paenibacillus qinlingensis TaxID=1837343 RepID=A0ABU1NYR5_9BACL|nr:BadF/BadG/BcrA/BcrD ATPase family protein [Paenibacillus qinlingensis]MDR6552643.1 glucosamine kinase [Paenibacillus qinlingensis]